VKEPSAVLFNLLGMLIEASKDVTATQNILTGDLGQANQPVGTTLAVIEQGLKTFTAIVKRIHRALKHELACLYDLNARYLNPQAYFTFQDEEGVVAQQDYAQGDVDVVPVSDPSMATDMQKMGRAQFLMQFLGKGLNDAEIIRRVLEAASIQDIKQLEPQGPPPPEPATDGGDGQAGGAAPPGRQQGTRSGHQAGLAEATIGVDVAVAQKTMAEAILALPAVPASGRALVDQRAREMMQAQQRSQGTPMAASSPRGSPRRVPGMAPQPPDAGVPGYLSDQQDLLATNGRGPGDGLPPPDQGPAPGGVGEPGMG
jgi:hypothetical protein